MDLEKLLYDTIRLLLIRYSQFGGDVASTNFYFRDNLKYHTAATDGKDVLIDPNYLVSLTVDERLFLLAHELLHKKFRHPFRLLDMKGVKKDADAWNDVCDALLNANLERDGFTIKEGYINWGQWVLKYSAEELYVMYLEDKESISGKSKSEPSEDENGYPLRDDHSLWEEAFEKNSDNNNNNDIDIDEREVFEEYRKEKMRIDSDMLKKRKDAALRSFNSNKIELGNVGNANYSIDWKLLLKKELSSDEIIWSNRRSIALNNYAYRLEDIEIEDDAVSEVLIDTSGSVEDELVKAFLRTLKPMVSESKLKVGCFDTEFYGFKDVEKVSDIDNLELVGGGGTNFNVAVNAFTKDALNKIVFTDGLATSPVVSPKDNNIIWLVYGNENFKPHYGKVINLTSDDLDLLNKSNLYKERAK